ncbi:MAG: IS3 family transposase [Acidiferrobacter sp.]
MAHAISVAHHESRKTYGTPRIQATLKACDVTVSRRRIARLMRLQGLRARVRRRFKATTDSCHTHPVAENILQWNCQKNSADGSHESET